MQHGNIVFVLADHWMNLIQVQAMEMKQLVLLQLLQL